MKSYALLFLLALFSQGVLSSEIDTSHRVWINRVLDHAYELSYSQMDSSLDLSRQALDSALYYNDSLIIRDAYLMIGDTYGWFGVYDSGNYYLEKALELSLALNDTFNVIYIQSEIGLNCINAGKYQLGMERLLESERISHIANDTSNIGWINYYMALAYHDQQNDAQKVRRLNQSLEFFQKNNQYNGILSASADLLVFYLDKDNDDSIAKYHSVFTEVYDRKDSLPSYGHDSYHLYTLAYYAYRQGNYEESERRYKEAIDSAKSINDNFSIASYSLDYVYLLLDLDRVEDAWIVLSDAVDASNEIQSLYINREVAYGLSDYYSHIGEWKSAYLELEKAQIINDSITDSRIDLLALNSDITSLENREESLKLESELLQKESDIRLLILTSAFLLVIVLVLTMGYVLRNNMKYKKMNQSLMVYQEKIENQNREIQESKEKIAQQHELVQNAYDTQGKIMSIVGHDLRTPLAQIKNILELERSGALSPIEKTEIFKELERTTVASLEMLSSLVNWGKAKLQSDGSRETSAQITKVLTEECNELYSTAIHQKNIHLSFIETDNIALPISEAETAVLIRNIVYNAIKFSNTNGDIQVEIRKEHGKPTLLIRDFGIGMTPDQVRRLSEGLNIESLRGTSNEGGFGLGMWFVRDITLRNHGNFTIESAPDRGSEFKIQFSSTDPK